MTPCIRGLKDSDTGTVVWANMATGRSHNIQDFLSLRQFNRTTWIAQEVLNIGDRDGDLIPEPTSIPASFTLTYNKNQEPVWSNT